MNKIRITFVVELLVVIFVFFLFIWLVTHPEYYSDFLKILYGEIEKNTLLTFLISMYFANTIYGVINERKKIKNYCNSLVDYMVYDLLSIKNLVQRKSDDRISCSRIKKFLDSDYLVYFDIDFIARIETILTIYKRNNKQELLVHLTEIAIWRAENRIYFKGKIFKK